ncbi:NADH-quinone oxidoreductase subunit NuoG [Enterobacteriaceae endosymbiont of Donacia bicoloricornis]|uniref:NADH-quinone oxidoreductase subunit NuoG n=1 Tax=Enterobacteriaceae endosymbiont of Donacia bicoloricornis TaxID=2675772 RepID=UPI001449C86E|nr:NADH-quinone oxidoreductase subunit NuoG [Enterobacteriaceae endosymbiont of Donacia bicoloricornis]QJC37877.1 NADH-quinone oxidoreductase subunit NuoG [Enterobacteriaceae endosymbiont of Donacia bicoloricornis]
MININIEGKFYKVNKKDNLLKICLSLGFNLPYFCWHPILGSIGSCRQCAIKQYDNMKKKNGQIIMSCMSSPIEGSYIFINDKDSINFRKKNIELLMLNHPHDCPICDEGGNCHLQDMTVMTGHHIRRFNFPKRKYKNQYLGPFISHIMNRCITCYRCVRFYKNYADGKDFNVFGSKDNIYFGKYLDGILESPFSGNLIEICPTGVFTDKTYNINYSRKWDLQYAPSICQHCSLGCNILVGERYGQLSSIQNRFHEKINHYFLCDKGYFGYGYTLLKSNPIKIIYYKNNEKLILNNKKIIKKITNLILKSKKIIGIGSPRASIESNFILKKLVGKNNFYLGILENEKKQINYIIKILQNKKIYFPTLSEIENYDAILILGEDLTNTNPRAALAVRQAIKNNLNNNKKSKNIPYWHSDAILNFRNKLLNPLFIISNDKTSLDDISLWNYYAPTIDQSKFGFILANYIKNNKNNNSMLNNKNLINQIIEIKKILLNAKKPLIISGTGSNSIELISASFAIAKELNAKKKDVGLFYVLNKVNSMGIGLIKGKSLQNLFIKNKVNKYINIDTIIIVENDLYFYEEKNKLNNFFKKIPNKIVLDHILTKTMKQANIILPTSNFLESNGTVINNECRAQRFFQVYKPSFYNKQNNRKSSWQWLYQIYARLNNLNKKITLDNLIKECEKYIPLLKGIHLASYSSTYKVYNRKFARSPIRFSGRTSILSNINVHEPKQPEDKDTIFNFSMEGNYNQNLNCSQIPFLWAPGWNSSQSLYKFQKEIGISSKYGPTGFKINCKKNYILKFKKKNYKDKFILPKKLIITAHYTLFNSNSLIQKSSLIQKYFSDHYVVLNKKDAEKLGILTNNLIELHCLNNTFILKVSISEFLHQGLISIPLGAKGIPLSFLGKIIEKIKVLK